MRKVKLLDLFMRFGVMALYQLKNEGFSLSFSCLKCLLVDQSGLNRIRKFPDDKNDDLFRISDTFQIHLDAKMKVFRFLNAKKSPNSLHNHASGLNLEVDR